MHHQQELVRLQRHFVLNDAILRNTHAVEPRTDGAQTSNCHGAFQSSHDPCNHRARHQHWAESLSSWAVVDCVCQRRRSTHRGRYRAAAATTSGECSVTLRGRVFSILSFAFSTSAAVPCTINKNLSVLSAISYLTTLSFGIPMP